MYSDKQPHFNCYQRAHQVGFCLYLQSKSYMVLQNTLENVPTFLGLVLLSSLQFPRLAASLGATWLLGRVVYRLQIYNIARHIELTCLLIGFY